MASEGNLLIGDEDAHFDSAFEFDGGITRKGESGFRKVGFVSDVLQLGVGKASGVGKNGELVPLEAMRGEAIDLDEMEGARAGRGGGSLRGR